VSDTSGKRRRTELLAETEACLADGRLTRDDLAQQYYLGKPPA